MLTIEELRGMDDHVINQIVARLSGLSISVRKGRVWSGTDGLTPDYAGSWDAIYPAVREWAKGDGARESAVLNHLPVTDRNIKAMLLFDITPRDLCHALILAAQEVGNG